MIWFFTNLYGWCWGWFSNNQVLLQPEYKRRIFYYYIEAGLSSGYHTRLLCKTLKFTSLPKLQTWQLTTESLVSKEIIVMISNKLDKGQITLEKRMKLTFQALPLSTCLIRNFSMTANCPFETGILLLATIKLAQRSGKKKCLDPLPSLWTSSL